MPMAAETFRLEPWLARWYGLPDVENNAEGNIIIAVGEALWGERWQSEMARALGVSRDTVQDWRQCRKSPRPGVYAELLKLAQSRQGDVSKAIEALGQIT